MLEFCVKWIVTGAFFLLVFDSETPAEPAEESTPPPTEDSSTDTPTEEPSKEPPKSDTKKMASRNAIVSLVFLAGAIVMIFFVILSAVTTRTPLNNTWFLQADTSGIEGARAITQWTYFYFCGDGNTDCSKAYADPAFGLAWAANATGAPEELLGPHGGDTTSTYYFYMWRFGWVFYIIGLFFAVAAFFMGFLAFFGRLGSAVSGFVSTVALFFYTFAVALMTTTFVKARNAFIANGQTATIGTYAFGFSWGAWAALLIATLVFCLGVRVDNKGVSRSRSTRSRASVEVNGRRVKDDYSLISTGAAVGVG